MAVKERVEEFSNIIEEQRKIIDSYGNELHRRILLLTLLDALAKYAFPKESSNKGRFVKFIDQYSSWTGKEHVSLIYLGMLLKGTEPTAYYGLKTEVSGRIGVWESARIYRWHNVDPSRTELACFNTSEEQRIIEKARFPSILWEMRNVGVHEFRGLATDVMGMGQENEEWRHTPYYYGTADASNLLRTAGWDLAIPAPFISKLVAKCAEKLANHFLNNGIDPSLIFPPKAAWLELESLD